MRQTIEDIEKQCNEHDVVAIVVPYPYMVGGTLIRQLCRKRIWVVNALSNKDCYRLSGLNINKIFFVAPHITRNTFCEDFLKTRYREREGTENFIKDVE